MTPQPPKSQWNEGVTLVRQDFTRWREVLEYADCNTGGDIAAAIVLLVNTGLSHEGPATYQGPVGTWPSSHGPDGP